MIRKEILSVVKVGREYRISYRLLSEFIDSIEDC